MLAVERSTGTQCPKGALAGVARSGVQATATGNVCRTSPVDVFGSVQGESLNSWPANRCRLPRRTGCAKMALTDSTASVACAEDRVTGSAFSCRGGPLPLDPPS